MDNTSIAHGKFHFKTLPDGSLDRIKVKCIYCKTVELSFPQEYDPSSISLVWEEMESPPPPSKVKRTTLDGVTWGPLAESTTWQLSTAHEPHNTIKGVGINY